MLIFLITRGRKSNNIKPYITVKKPPSEANPNWIKTSLKKRQHIFSLENTGNKIVMNMNNHTASSYMTHQVI